MVEERFVPVRVMERRHQLGGNTSAADSLQRAFGVTVFPTLVIYSPTSRRLYTREGFGGADSLGRWMALTTMKERFGALTSRGSRR